MADGFKINKAYAEKYNNWRQKEELQKLKDKYGDEDASESSSSSESEDDDAEALTGQLERDWLRTLAALKSKDPRIYEKDVKFYHDEEDGAGTHKEKRKTDKPMFLKDYERKLLLEKGGIVNENEGKVPSTSTHSYHEEQEQLRKSIVAAVGSSSDDSDTDSDNDGLLIPRQKTRVEKQQEEADYVEWLKGQKDSPTDEVGVELVPLKNYWQRKDLDEGEKFLKNYILNKQYIDRDEEMPTYDEIVDEDGDDLSEDEELLTRQDNFERKFNFRFEEPEAAEVKTYPRNFDETVRRKDTKRSEKRKEVQDRKKHEKEKKKEEIKQLKKLKRNEILEKIEKLRQITGNKDLAFNEEELEEEFDPAKHDEMMKRCFDDEYYNEGDGEDVKPTFEMSDDEYDNDNWENWTGAGPSGDQGTEDWGDDDYTEPNIDDPGFCMDADYDPEADEERKKNKKNKKRNKLAQALSAKKPVFDPNEKTFEEYFDEYYKLDYEDIIDDMPCRFKYRKVTSNTYGLSVDEVLKARDKELNAWASVKKMSQYRTEQEEQTDLRAYNAKGSNVKKKQHILTSIFESEEKPDEKKETIGTSKPLEEESKKKKKRRNRKKKKPNQDMNYSQDSGVESQAEIGGGENKEKIVNQSQVKKIENQSKNKIIEKESESSSKKMKKLKGGDSERTSEQLMDVSVEKNISDKKKGKNKTRSGELTESITKMENESFGDCKKRKADSDGEADKAERNKAKKLKVNTSEEVPAEKTMETNKSTSSELGNKKKKKRNKKKGNKKLQGNQKLQLSDERLKAYGINPKKYKYMKKEELFQVKPRKQNT